jgi:hypothetical protein
MTLGNNNTNNTFNLDNTDAGFDRENIKKFLESKLIQYKENISKDNLNSNYIDYIDIIKNINMHHYESTPFVNGYYYIHVQNGNWIKNYNSHITSTQIITNKNNPEDLKKIGQNMGKYIFQTELPNIMLETETVSGRLKNVNYATKLQLTGDFSISYHDNYKLDVNNYHNAWLKYIDLLRRGDINLLDEVNYNDTDPFFEVPYFNAIWVIIFIPMTTIPIAIFKLMGVMPINTTHQQLLGDRGSPTIGLFNQSYKCNDIIFDINNLGGQENNSLFSELNKEFLKVFKEGTINEKQ